MSWVTVLHETALAEQVRDSQYLYPLLQCVHVVGLSMFAGSLALVNLRLAGVGQAVALHDFARHALRIAWLGFVMVLITGASMAVGFIDVFSVSTVMQIKLTLVALLLINALVLQQKTACAQAPWAIKPPAPRVVRCWVTVAITLIFTVVALGKLLAYIGGKD